MADTHPKATRHRYLQTGRDAVVRPPLPPTGTNLLGLVKHLAGVGR